jgi:hypothetical protein
MIEATGQFDLFEVIVTFMAFFMPVLSFLLINSHYISNLVVQRWEIHQLEDTF